MVNKKKIHLTLSLVIVSLTYLLIGAAVFDFMESSNELKLNDNFRAYREKFQIKHEMNDTDFDNMMIFIRNKKNCKGGNRWKFIGSFYFCMSSLTLIGYG